MATKIFCDLCGEESTPKAPQYDTPPKAQVGNSYVSWDGDVCIKCSGMFSKNLEEIKEKYIELTQPLVITIEEQNKNFTKYLTKLVMLDKLSD